MIRLVNAPKMTSEGYSSCQKISSVVDTTTNRAIKVKEERQTQKNIKGTAKSLEIFTTAQEKRKQWIQDKRAQLSKVKQVLIMFNLKDNFLTHFPVEVI